MTMRFQTCVSLCLLACLALYSPGQASDGGLSQAWTLISDRDGIQVYFRHTEQSRLKTFRGVTRIRQSDEFAAIAMMEDYDSYPRWLHMIDHAEELGRAGPLTRWIRVTTRLPWPLQDREAIVKSQIIQKVSPQEESLTILNTNAADFLPHNPDYVRFPEVYSRMTATRLGNGEHELVYEVVLDPGGYIPDWLVNLLMRDTPFFTLQKIRRMMAEPAYLGRYYTFFDGRGPGRPDTLPEPVSYLYGNPPETEAVIIAPDDYAVEQVAPASSRHE